VVYDDSEDFDAKIKELEKAKEIAIASKKAREEKERRAREEEEARQIAIQKENETPEEFNRYYPSQLEAKKIKKPLVCYLIDISDKNARPTLVTKPIKVKYGAKWFGVGREQKYFINYNMIMNFGKRYAYLCQYGNAVGALSFHEYPEIVDANQVELMANQHAVEVFKKHKGISPKLVLIIAVVCAVAVIGLVISIQILLGLNNQVTSLKLTNAKQATDIKDLQCKIDGTLQQCQPVLPPNTVTGNTVKK